MDIEILENRMEKSGGYPKDRGFRQLVCIALCDYCCVVDMAVEESLFSSCASPVFAPALPACAGLVSTHNVYLA